MIRRATAVGNPYDIRHKMSADFKFFKQLIKKGTRFIRVDYPVARFDTGGISNSKRSDGLKDNMKIILEVDGPLRGFPQIMHLLPTYLISRLRGK